MTNVLIIGGGGMIGQKLARALHRQTWSGKVDLADMAFPDSGAPCASQISGSVTDLGFLQQLVARRPDVIVYLASVVSGEAELDFEKGWHTNMLAMWHMLETLRAAHIESQEAYRPKFVFTSSVAVFGAPLPEPIDDDFQATPHSSYGAQKVACEQMVNDFSRKGFIDGISLRLPTISVRPGRANKAATSFFSGIIREPLNGQEAILPVDASIRHAHASPRSAVGFVMHAMTLDTQRLDGRTALNMPCLPVTVEEQIEALRDVAGQRATELIRYQHDDLIAGLVDRWPRSFDAARARSLGFTAENDFREIVEIYLADDFEGRTNSAR
ncbi:MAG: D-erythronate dehydrogenase [Arenibacterium sp.]